MSTITLLATMMPIEILLEKVESAISDYKIDSTDANKTALVAALHMTLINVMNDGKVENAEEMSKRLSQMENRQKLFEIPKN
jgi:hypothetical protein